MPSLCRMLLKYRHLFDSYMLKHCTTMVTTKQSKQLHCFCSNSARKIPTHLCSTLPYCTPTGIITRWMHDIVGRAWASAHAECGPDACTGVSSECGWTSGRRISQKVHGYNTGTRRSGLAKSCCTQAGPAHATGHVEMAWTDQSHLWLACATGSPHRYSQKRSESSNWNLQLGNKDKRHRQIAMQLPLDTEYTAKKHLLFWQLQLLPELQLLTRNSPMWQPAMAIQHTWSTGTAEVATMAGKFA